MLEGGGAMTAFVSAAALLTLAALAFVLWPLLRARARAPMSLRQANLSVYRDQFAELERDLALGVLDAGQYENARGELERRLLDEVGGESAGQQAPARRSAWIAAAVIGIGIPVLAGLLYLKLGTPEALDASKHAAIDPASITVEQFQAMTEKLAQRQAANPDDVKGWLMLGRAYKALDRNADAVQALSEANRRQPGDVEILVELAEATALAQDRNLEGEPRKLLERALAIDPDDEKALTLAGTAAFARKDYRAAIGYWERLRKRVPAESELGQALARGIEEARTLSGIKQAPERASAGAPEAIRGEVRLAAALKQQAAPDDTVFVFVRAAEGPRMPLAVLTKKVKDLPTRFQLDDSQSMTPALKLSGFPKLIVSARVSKSGSAAPQPGDLQGASGIVAPGTAGVVVTIDSVVQ
jgi:cytochrome c-type biogenesis protein CcmH